MSGSHAEKIPRQPKELRDQTRRDHIVQAARGCVLRHGFHATSMAEIAAAAHMSVGQIYRYFPNKEAVVHAMVERIVAMRLSGVPRTGAGNPDALAQRLTGVLDDEEERENQVLVLEVTAEATRNPAVAQIVADADRCMHAHLVALLRGRYPDLSAEEMAARVELLAVLVEGTIFRRVTGQRADNALLVELYRDLIARVLP